MKRYLIILFTLSTNLLFAQSFEKIENVISERSGASRAATFADVDNDGWLDAFITNGPRDGEHNELFMNDGSGNFTRNMVSQIASDNSPSDGATWGDVDNDGDLDLYVVTWYGAPNYLYLFGESNQFVRNNAITSNGFSETASWADFDKDGYLDLYITNSSNGAGNRNEFFVNLSDGSFRSETSSEITKTISNSRSVNWIDYDNDDDLDIFVSNENTNTTNELYNNDAGVFTALDNAVTSTSNRSTGSSWADYDNDGDLDLYVANFGTENEFFKNEGDGTFTMITVGSIVTDANSSFGTSWGDIDNDGDLDLFVANAFDANGLSNDLYINNGDGSFTKDESNAVVQEQGWTFGAAFGDYDNDGFLDLLLANTLDESQKNNLFHNLGNENHWLIIDLEGTISNMSAIGAKIKVTAQIGQQEVVQLREVSSQSGYNGQNSLRAHFGLGDATKVTSMEIIWPLGNVETFDNLDTDQIMEIKEAIPEDFLRANFKIENDEYMVDTPIDIEDLSVYEEGADVTYAWDFDNDGTIDSDEKTPKATYAAGGTYTVKLTISNTAGKSSEITREDYVVVQEPVVAGIKADGNVSSFFYPNPMENRITIKSDQPVKQVKILDWAGRTVRKYDSLKNNAHPTINIENLDLKTGSYIISIIKIDGSTEQAKLIKSN